MRVASLPLLVLTYVALAGVSASAAVDYSSFPVLVELDGPRASQLVLQESPSTDFSLGVVVMAEKPGAILDTVGINAAPVGSWTLRIAEDGTVTVQVYDPGHQSPVRVENGWHILPAPGRIMFGNTGIVRLSLQGLRLTLSVDDGVPASLDLRVPLSGDPLYAGDFPGDDHWGEGYNVHPGMTGSLLVMADPPASEPPAGPESSLSLDTVIDDTAALSAADVTAIAEALRSTCLARSVEMAVLISPLAGSELSSRARELRRSLMAAGDLPDLSVAFVFSSDSRVMYSYSTAVGDWLKPAVSAAWQATPPGLPIAEKVRRFLLALAGESITTTAPAPPDDVTGGQPTPGEQPDELEVVAIEVERALKAADLEALLAATHSSRREVMRAMLHDSADDMRKLGQWLSGRKRVSTDGETAEYEVAVEQALLCVRFTRAEGQWWLLSL